MNKIDNAKCFFLVILPTVAITAILVVFGLNYFSDAGSAAVYCGTFVERGVPYQTKYPHDSIRLIDGDWYCVDYIKECKYDSCKVVDSVVIEKVPKEYLDWKRST